MPNISLLHKCDSRRRKSRFCTRTDGRTLVTFEMWVSGLRGAPAGRKNRRSAKNVVLALFYDARNSQENFEDLRIPQSRNILIFVQ